MKLFKNKLALIILGILITSTSILAGVTISYVYNKTVSDTAIVGDTVKYTDGLVITLIDRSDYTLTYEAIEETDTQKHEITYTYSYEFIGDEMDIEVSSLTNDIVVSNIDNTDNTISITFGLNQDATFSDGDVLNIQFYFEGIQIVAININTVTEEQLLSLGFLDYQVNIILQNKVGHTFTNFNEWAGNTGITDFTADYQYLVDEGLIVFN